MKNLLFAAAVAAFACLSSGCKEPEKTWIVRYKVVNYEPTSASFRVNYTTADGSTAQRGPLTTNFWISDEEPGVETNAEVSLTFERLSGSGDFELFIEVNGSVIESANTSTPNTPVTVSAIVVDPSDV